MKNRASQFQLRSKRILRTTEPRIGRISLIEAIGPIALLPGLILLTACSEDFAPFNTVDRFRVLSLQAEPPALAEGETAEISPLMFVSDDDFEGVTYKWSWCPIAVRSADGAECAISEEMFKAVAAQMVRESTNADISALLEGLPLSFDLGASPTASFVYALPADVLLQVCESLLTQDIPTDIGFPDCREKLNVIIRLETTYGDEKVIATKQIPLYINEERADNENPNVDGMAVTDANGKKLDLSVERPVLYRGERYELHADIRDEASQTFTPPKSSATPNPVPVKEYLFMTWYPGGGETDFARTTFLDGEVPMETLRGNSWRIPAEVDYPADEIDLYLVLQDERGGTGWFAKRFAVEAR